LKIRTDGRLETSRGDARPPGPAILDPTPFGVLAASKQNEDRLASPQRSEGGGGVQKYFKKVVDRCPAI